MKIRNSYVFVNQYWTADDYQVRPGELDPWESITLTPITQFSISFKKVPGGLIHVVTITDAVSLYWPERGKHVLCVQYKTE